MDPLDAARSALPTWAVYGNAVLGLGLAGASTLLISAIAWRISRPTGIGGAHWTEQARQCWAGRQLLQAALVHCFLLFGWLGAFLLGPLAPIGPEDHVVAVAIGIYSLALVLPVLHGRRCRRLLSDTRPRSGRLAHIVVMQLQTVVVALTMLLLPAEIDPVFWIVAGLGGVLLVFTLLGGGCLLAGWLGLFRPGPAWLCEVARDEARARRIEMPRVLVGEMPAANAFAHPLLSRIIVTSRLLEVLERDQTRTVIAHEVAHLANHRRQTWAYLILSLPLWLTFMGARPMIAHLGLVAWIIALALGWALQFLHTRLCRGAETEADELARESASGPRAYAETLERLHRDNLAPAVLESQSRTHPELYDRISDTGVTSEYERPTPPPPRENARIGLYLLALGLVATVFVVQGVIGLTTIDSEKGVLRAIAVTGGTGELLQLAGVHRLDDGAFLAAESLFRCAESLDPDSPANPAYLAITLAEQGRTTEAQTALERAEELLTPDLGGLHQLMPIVDRARTAVR